MMKTRCHSRGSLGPTRFSVSDAPARCRFLGDRENTLCSHIGCSACGQTVCSHDGLTIVGGPDVLPAAYAANDPLQVEGVKKGLASYRLYLCHCDYIVIGGVMDLELAHTQPELGLPTTWACAGHPVQQPPVAWDGRSTGSAPSWPELIESVFRDPLAKREHRLARVIWVRQVRGLLGGSTHVRAIDDVIEGLLDSSDPVLLSHALHFLWAPMKSAVIDLLPSIVLTQESALRGLKDPMGLPDLYDTAMRTVASHIDRGRLPLDGEILTAMRSYAAQQDRLEGVGWMLARRDRPWFIEHKVALVESSPSTAAKAARW